MDIIRVDPNDLKLHEAASAIPSMRADEWQGFLADVRENGVLEPLVIQRDNIILDGRHRWQAARECEQVSIPARIVDLTPTQQVNFIIRAAVMRRHLSDDQRAVLAARLQRPLSRAVVQEASQKAATVRHNPNNYGSEIVSEAHLFNDLTIRDTRAEAAQQFNVSEWKVRKAIDLERTAPDLAEQVLAGELDLIRAKRELKEREREEQRQQNRLLVEETPPLAAHVNGRHYQTIVLDPPWDWGDEGDVDQFGRGRPVYNTIPFDEIAALPIDDLADGNAHIYLWITNRSLPKGFALLERWRFRYITCLTWCKPSIGMGNYFRGSTEQILFGVRGSLPLLRRDMGTWFMANRPGEHSGKPDEFYALVESCSPGPWLEIFPRKARNGWTGWGAEACYTTLMAS